MPDPRWPGTRGPAAPPPPTAPAWAAFQRTREAGVVLRPTAAPRDTLHLLGTAPPLFTRRRSAANSQVYVVDLHTVQAHRATPNTVPVVGEVAAGAYSVTVAYRDYDQHEYGLAVDPTLVPPGSGAYALRVRGTSMTHVGIDPGDLVVIQPGDCAQNGDFVVAWLPDSEDPEGYVTLKRFYRKNSHIFLQSATADRDPIRLYPFGRGRGADRDRVKVQGRVIVVIKA